MNEMLAGRSQYDMQNSLMNAPVRAPSVLERLTSEKERLEYRLKQVNEALALLDAQPAVKDVLEALSKIGF